MRPIRLLVAACALLAGGCAAFDTGPPPLTKADVVRSTRAGETPAALVQRLKSTQTVLWLTATEIVELRQAGVAMEVLDYLQAAQFAEMRRGNQFYNLLYGPERTPFSRCTGYPSPDGRFRGFSSPFC